MTLKIETITVRNLIGSVNCYLIKADKSCILVDTGLGGMRKELLKKLEKSDDELENLKLIILTHGDFDHIGSAAFLRKKYGAPIAMHQADSGMAELGDMFWNRKKPNIFMKGLAETLFKLNKSDRFLADIFVDEGFDLSKYGISAKILHIPGHSAGSIGVLTSDGSFFCGDLLENRFKPALNSIMDDKEAAQASLEKIMGLNINTVYPGHGRPFSLEQFLEKNRQQGMPAFSTAPSAG